MKADMGTVGDVSSTQRKVSVLPVELCSIFFVSWDFLLLLSGHMYEFITFYMLILTDRGRAQVLSLGS